MRKNGIVNKYEYVKEKITMDNKEKALLCHKEWNGKLETVAKSKVKTREDLAIAYTPGVAEPCKVIAEDKTAAYTYTWKANTVAVVSDGSAVLGLTVTSSPATGVIFCLRKMPRGLHSMMPASVRT